MAKLTKVDINRKGLIHVEPLGSIKPFLLGSKRDRFTAILITKLMKKDLKLIGFGLLLSVMVLWVWYQALTKTGVL